MTADDHNLLALTTEIVAARASNGTLTAAELPGLIATVYAALRSAGQTAPAPMEPAGPIGQSIVADYIVCLEDGQKLKMLKRHLAAFHGLTPEAYRQRWGLPRDYPIVAPPHAAQRSAIAKAIGLGGKRVPARGVGGRRSRPPLS